MKNLYETLGVSQNADIDEITKAFRNLSKQYHPDAWVSAPEQVQKEKEEMLKVYSEAYAILSNPVKRQEYDTKLSFGGFDNLNREKENSFQEAFFDSLFNDNFETPKMKSGLYEEIHDIEVNIGKRKGEIYEFWNGKRDQLNKEFMPYMQEYGTLEIQLRMIDSQLINLKNMKICQIMPSFYKKKKEKLEADYNIIAKKYEELKKKINEYEQKKQEISSALQTQLENDPELLRLQSELKQVEEQLEDLNKQSRR